MTSQFFAPGRVNLIGEHVDYNGGSVLPAALSLGIHARVRGRKDRVITFRSSNVSGEVAVCLGKTITFDVSHGWANYPKGIVAYLQAEGYCLQGCDILYSGDLPIGAGLSSSAAIEVLTAYGLLYPQVGDSVDRVWLAQLCRKVENEFVGVRCGIMDQFAVANGKAHNAMLLDCQTLNCHYVPMDLGAHSLVVMDTGKRRDLGGSEFNERRAQCEQVLEQIRKHREIPNLCTATFQDVCRWVCDPVLRRRARHVISENRRTLEAAGHLFGGRLKEFGRLLLESHLSLKEDFEVTGFELDTAVKLALSSGVCLGARMTGAGFGGCVIALVESAFLHRFEDYVGSAYESETGLCPEFHVSAVGDGVRLISSKFPLKTC